MKTSRTTVAIFVALASAVVSAHGVDASRHGGVVAISNDVNYELVLEEDDAIVYVVDHGRPVPSAGMTGTLATVNLGRILLLEFTPAGDNTLRAKAVKVTPGSEIVVLVRGASGAISTVRFTAR